MAEDEYYVDSPVVHAFIEEVQRVAEVTPDRGRTVQFLRPAFAALLADRSWLPTAFQQADPAGGMGSGIANYLIYRAAAGDLSLSILVLPPGASTPVHDHLAWGLVGLYSGAQDEWVYRRADDGHIEGRATFDRIEPRHLESGDFYELLPPDGDIHSVQATGNVPSISVHLLGNDVGCVWRHRYEPDAGRVHPFRSSYSNKPCPED